MDFFDIETKKLAEYYRKELDKIILDAPHSKLRKEKELSYAQIFDIYQGIKQIFEQYDDRKYELEDFKRNRRSFNVAHSIVNLVVSLSVKTHHLKKEKMNVQIYELISVGSFDWAKKLLNEDESKETHQYLKSCLNDVGHLLGFEN